MNPLVTPRQQEARPSSLFARIGRHELIMLIGFTVLAGGIWLTIQLADAVVDGSTAAFDEQIIMALREAGDSHDPIGPPWLAEMFRDFTALGGTGILSLIVAVVSLYYLIQGRFREMLVLLVAVLGALLLSYTLKDAFGRPRPQFVPAGDYPYSASFPSGHALLATATYLTISSIVAQLIRPAHLKAYVILVAFVIVGLVGFSRVYLGVHWPTDVLAGWTIGAVWALFWWLVVRWLRRRGMFPAVTPLNFQRKVGDKAV